MASADQAAQAPRTYGFLRRGRVKLEILRALAEDVPTRDIAKRWGCNVSSINDMRRDYRAQVDEIKASLEDEFAGLWIAQKRQRVASYEAQIEDLETLLAREMGKGAGSEDDADALPTDVDAVAKLTKALDRARRQAAEELGQLPSRVRINVTGERVEMDYGDTDAGAL